MASLEDRISKPQNGQAADNPEAPTGANIATPISATEKIESWADEASAADTNSGPSAEKDEASAADTNSGPSAVKDKASAADTNSGPSAVKDKASAANTNSGPSAEKAEAKKETSSLSRAQTDGASGEQGGTSGIYEPSYEVDVQLSELQKDSNNPLHSIKSFEELGLDNKILQGIYQMRFTKPSKIQEKALPLLLINPPQNMIGQSQSGTGKTAAFVLNILARLDFSDRMVSKPQAMVLAPSRELARQIMGVCQVMGQALERLKVEASIPVDKSERGKEITGQVVVGTPGTTMDLIRRRQLDATNIRILVLDEADNMLDQQGLGDQCIRVKHLLPKTVQVVLFSATFPDRVVEYATKFAPNSNTITLRHEELTVDGIKQLYLDCPTETDKYDALIRLYGLMTIGSSIIFVKTRKTALEIERRMNEEGHTVACLTGEFEGSQRDIIIDSFRSGQSKVLIATNVLARGIDVQTVSLVVNYDLPDDGRGHADSQTYLHRIGRTGRFGRVGVSISLITGQRSLAMVKEISNYFSVEMTPLPHDDWDKVENIIKKVIKSTRASADYNKAGKSAEINM